MAESILVWNVSGIGDFVDSTPALRLLRHRKPTAFIALAVSEKVLPLAERCPYMDETLGIPTSRGRSAPGIREVPRWIRRMASIRGRFSIVVNLYEMRSSIGAEWFRFLLRCLGAPVSIGRNTEGRAPFFTHAVEDSDGPRDQVERFLSVVSAVPAEDVTPAAEVGRAHEQQLELWIPREIAAEVREWLAGEAHWGACRGPKVLVALGGERRSRHEWPERAARWVKALQDEQDIRPIVWGTLEDPGLPAGTSVAHLDTRGRCDLLHSVALFACVDAVVTTHSAPQHLAGVWGVPTVVLAGPGDTVKYRPHLPAGCVRILRHPLPCSPCYYADCPRPGVGQRECLRSIAIEEIVHAVRDVITLRRIRATTGL